MENLENKEVEEVQEPVFEIEEGLEVYKTVDVKPKKENTYQKTLKRLAEQKNLKASLPFPNEFVNKFKVAADKLKADGLHFNFRIDVKNPETHTRVWWTDVIPTPKKKKEVPTLIPDEEIGE